MGVAEFRKLQSSYDENEELQKQYREKIQILSENDLLSLDITTQSPQIKKLMREHNKNIVNSGHTGTNSNKNNGSASYSS